MIRNNKYYLLNFYIIKISEKVTGDVVLYVTMVTGWIKHTFAV